MAKLIFVPGVGKAERSVVGRIFTWFMQRRGFDVLIFHPKWMTDEPIDEKIARLKQALEPKERVLLDQQPDAILVGYSAGAALVVASGLVRRGTVKNVYLVSGKLRGYENIGPYYRRKYPALQETVRLSENEVFSLQENEVQKIVTTRPLVDLLVPLVEMKIQGAYNKRVFAYTHPWGIVAGLWYICRVIDKNRKIV